MATARTRWLQAAALIALIIFCWPATTRQGVNYHVSVRRIPLGVKVAQFLWRDAAYRRLVREIVRGAGSEKERALRILVWTRSHIAPSIPAGTPIVDDHVWSIIKRGYGSSDQLADVFSTLCAYAGLPAQMLMTDGADAMPPYPLTMVKLGGHWYPFDPYVGVLVTHPDGRLANREEILVDLGLVRRAAPGRLSNMGVEYAQLYAHLPDLEAAGDLRPYRQMPWRRLSLELSR